MEDLHYRRTKTRDFPYLMGKVLASVEGAYKGSEQIIFTTTTGQRFALHHFQCCCENVEVVDVVGDVADLLGSPVLRAEERTNSEDDKPSEYSESFTWTFYELATNKGSVTIRWLGESNGYYSESVDFSEIIEREDA